MGETPDLSEPGVYVEERYQTKVLASGEKKQYGPYFYKRWREGDKLRSLFLGKVDPRTLSSNSTSQTRTDN